MPTYNVAETVGAGPQNRPGSIEARLGVNPLTGTVLLSAQEISRLSPELQRLVPEYEARSTPAQRADARARRAAEDRASEAQAGNTAVEEYRATGILPVGWVVLQNPRQVSCSDAFPIDENRCLARIEQVENLTPHGFLRE